MSDEPLDALLALLRDDPLAPIADSTRGDARRVHIDDSLSGLEFEQLRDAGRVADVGSGAGLPGLVIAAELREAELDMIESVRRKCEFIERAAAAMGLLNAGVVNGRAEQCGRECARDRTREPYAAVTARAVARLSTLAELASPLLREDGHLLAWKGRRDPGEEAELERALPRVAMEVVEVRPVTPYPGSRDRHIHLLRKNGPTPNDLPRRDGLAAKRPFGGE